VKTGAKIATEITVLLIFIWLARYSLYVCSFVRL